MRYGATVNWMPEVLLRLRCRYIEVRIMPKVLVVDDTKNIRNMLTTCLEIEGYKVVSASNGREAFDLLHAGEFDLVFLDIKLPEISGTEVLRRIREMGNTVPVIIMTAFATVKNAVECTKPGAVAYLQKPFTAEKVRHVLAEIKEPSNTTAYASTLYATKHTPVPHLVLSAPPKPVTHHHRYPAVARYFGSLVGRLLQ